MKILNQTKKDVPIQSIKIPYYFANKIPCNEKLSNRLNEWRKCREFKTKICVDEDMILFDGYTAYLIYKMLGYDTVPVDMYRFI